LHKGWVLHLRSRIHLFLAYLHARYTLDWKGRRAAILAIIGFLAVLFTYVGVDFLLPQIHGTK